MTKNTQAVNEVLPVVETTDNSATMLAVMTEADASYVIQQHKKVAKLVLSDYETVDGVLKVLSFDEKTLAAMRVQLFASKGLTGNLDADIASRVDVTTVKFGGKEYKLSDALPIADELTQDPMSKFADAFKVEFNLLPEIVAAQKAMELVKAKFVEYVSASNLPIALTYNFQNGTFSHTYTSRRKGNSGKTINGGEVVQKGADYEPNSTFDGQLSGWSITVVTDDKRFTVTMTKDGQPDYIYGGSLLKSERNASNKGIVSAILAHVRANGAPNTNIGWKQLFPEQKLYVNLPTSDVKRTAK